MDQISLQKDPVGRESTKAKKVDVLEDCFDKWISVQYSENKNHRKGKLMSFEDSLSYLAASNRKKVDIRCPETTSDLDHMAKIMDICKDRKIEITLENSEQNGLTGPFLKMGVEKCIGKKKNTIIVRHHIVKDFDDVDSQSTEWLKIENKSIKFCCDVEFPDKPVLPHLVNSLKLLTNNDRSVHLYLNADIKTLFESMQWTFDQKMVNWLENSTKREYIMLEDKCKPMDNNEYKIMHANYERERESDCESEISDDEFSPEETALLEILS